jgi:3-oxoacyl-[acyl-carrier-protein] synthase II
MLALQSGDDVEHALAEIAGFGAAHDAVTAATFNPEAVGATEAITLALESAFVKPEDVSCIISGASGSRAGDLMELRALQNVFGDRLKDIPLHVPKAALGETLGAAGSVAALCGALALSRQCLPPSPGCSHGELALSSHEQPFSGETALVTAFGCDGNNAAMILRRRR